MVALVGGGLAAQLLGFILSAMLLLLVVRPVARRHFRKRGETPSGFDALKGANAVVLQRVDGHGGQVKLAGEVWSARAWDGDRVLEPGTQVQVLQIEGATAVVYDVESTWKA